MAIGWSVGGRERYCTTIHPRPFLPVRPRPGDYFLPLLRGDRVLGCQNYRGRDLTASSQSPPGLGRAGDEET